MAYFTREIIGKCKRLFIPSDSIQDSRSGQRMGDKAPGHGQETPIYAECMNKRPKTAPDHESGKVDWLNHNTPRQIFSTRNKKGQTPISPHDDARPDSIISQQASSQNLDVTNAAGNTSHLSEEDIQASQDLNKQEKSRTSIEVQAAATGPELTRKPVQQNSSAQSSSLVRTGKRDESKIESNTTTAVHVSESAHLYSLNEPISEPQRMTLAVTTARDPPIELIESADQRETSFPQLEYTGHNLDLQHLERQEEVIGHTQNVGNQWSPRSCNQKQDLQTSCPQQPVDDMGPPAGNDFQSSQNTSKKKKKLTKNPKKWFLSKRISRDPSKTKHVSKQKPSRDQGRISTALQSKSRQRKSRNYDDHSDFPPSVKDVHQTPALPQEGVRPRNSLNESARHHGEVPLSSDIHQTPHNQMVNASNMVEEHFYLATKRELDEAKLEIQTLTLTLKNTKSKLHQQKENNKNERKTHEREVAEMRAEIDSLQRNLTSIAGKTNYVSLPDSDLRASFKTFIQRVNNIAGRLPNNHAEAVANTKVDKGGFLDRKARYGGHNWTKYVRSICWRAVIQGFYSRPLGFGSLGEESQLHDLHEVFTKFTGDKFPTSERPNIWRSILFDTMLVAIDSQQGRPSDMHDALSDHFDTNVQRVTTELIDLLHVGANKEVEREVSTFVREVGVFSLRLGSQQAHVYLDTCDSQDVLHSTGGFLQNGEKLPDNTTVDIMLHPCLRRIGDGNGNFSSEKVIVCGEVVSL